jgi:nucleotide-binding universal stress UspA family protein
MQADMIVIGTHGRSGLPHALLGSVAEKVVRTASCPVLTIRPEAFQFEMP